MKNKILFICAIISANNLYSMESIKWFLGFSKKQAVQLDSQQRELDLLNQQQEELKAVKNALDTGIKAIFHAVSKPGRPYHGGVRLGNTQMYISLNGFAFQITREIETGNFEFSIMDMLDNNASLCEFTIQSRIYQTDIISMLYAHLVNIFDSLLFKLNKYTTESFVAHLSNPQFINSRPELVKNLTPKSIRQPESLEEALNRLNVIIDHVANEIQKYENL